MGKKRKRTRPKLAGSHAATIQKMKRSKNVKTAAKESSRKRIETSDLNSYNGWTPLLEGSRSRKLYGPNDLSQLQPQNFWEAHIAQRKPAILPYALAGDHCKLLALDSWSLENLKNSAVSLAYLLEAPL